jgi:hypothetical protein
VAADLVRECEEWIGFLLGSDEPSGICTSEVSFSRATELCLLAGTTLRVLHKAQNRARPVYCWSFSVLNLFTVATRAALRGTCGTLTGKEYGSLGVLVAGDGVDIRRERTLWSLWSWWRLKLRAT